MSDAEDRQLRSEVDASAEAHVRSKTPGKLATLLDLVKFEHSIFALPYAYIGALYGVAAGRLLPPLSAVLWITVAMVGARSFAFVLNRAIDAEIDASNPRTAGRAIPAGHIRAGELLAFSLVVLGAFLFAVWQLHPITRYLWPIVLVAFLVYPYLKRFTWVCHYWLGLCLGLAPVGAWVAVTGDLGNPVPWVFGLAVLFWTAGFDIIYALQDIDCDVRDHLHSAPVDFGVKASLAQVKALHVLTWLLLIVAGRLVGAGWPYFAGVVVAAGLLGYENAIVKADDFSRVNAAFFTMNGVIAVVVFAGALADRLLG